MTREERLELLKQIEKDIHVCSLESTFLDDAKSCAIHSIIEELEQEPKTGHWKIIPCGNNHGEYRPPKYICSECGWEIDLCRGLQQDTGHRLFCEHCGAKMESEES